MLPKQEENITNVTLGNSVKIRVYSGRLANAFSSMPTNLTGNYSVFVGYRLASGEIIFNSRSIDFSVVN